MPPMPEKLLLGKACVICDILASDSGRIAGPPRPPVETNPSTWTSKSSVSASISGSDVKVLDETIASAPPRNAPRASTTMSVVDGVSLAQTGIFATSLTTFVTIDTSSLSLPTLDPISGRSMWGQERYNSSAPHPCSWHATARSRQCQQLVPVTEPAMMQET